MKNTIKKIYAAVAAAVVTAACNAEVSTATVPSKSKYASGPTECVAYARRFASFPTGMWTFADKKSMINTGTPKAGRVAVMNMGAVGHVGVVVDVDDTGKAKHIVIAEANNPIGNGAQFRKATCSKIDDCEKSLHILGYHK